MAIEHQLARLRHQVWQFTLADRALVPLRAWQVVRRLFARRPSLTALDDSFSTIAGTTALMTITAGTRSQALAAGITRRLQYTAWLRGLQRSHQQQQQ